MEFTYSVEYIEKQLVLLGSFDVLGDSGGHLDVDEAGAHEHQVVGDVTILQDDLSLGVSLALKLADDLVDDVVVQLPQVVDVPDHLLSELHVLVVVVFQHFLQELLSDVWEVLLEQLNIFLAEVCASAVTFGLNGGCSFQLREQGYLSEYGPLLQVADRSIMVELLLKR